MLDARFVRENPDVVQQAMAVRNASWDIDAFLALDAERRRLIGETEALQAQRNEASRAIGELMKAGSATRPSRPRSRCASSTSRSPRLTRSSDATELDTRDLLMTAPNLPDETVPIGADETENVEVRRWGTPPAFDFEPQAHWDLGPALGIVDFERAVKLAESRFVLLARLGARLNRALINLMLDTHAEAGYLEWAPPVLANAETLTGTGQLPKFAEDLYQTDRGPLPDPHRRGAAH